MESRFTRHRDASASDPPRAPRGPPHGPKCRSHGMPPPMTAGLLLGPDKTEAMLKPPRNLAANEIGELLASDVPSDLATLDAYGFGLRLDSPRPERTARHLSGPCFHRVACIRNPLNMPPCSARTRVSRQRAGCARQRWQEPRALARGSRTASTSWGPLGASWRLRPSPLCKPPDPWQPLLIARGTSGARSAVRGDRALLHLPSRLSLTRRHRDARFSTLSRAWRRDIA
jgi:hypothetical protein